MSATPKWLSRFARLLPTAVRPSTTEAPTRLQVLRALRQLQPRLYESYTPALGQAVILEVPCPRIDQFNQLLSEIVVFVRNDRPIDPATIPRETFRVSLDRFLTSSDGFYLQADQALEQLKTLATQLCEALDASDYVQYGPQEHNLRMLTATLQSLYALVQQLVRISQQG